MQTRERNLSNSTSMMSLAPYTGSWGKGEVLHLLRRTTFGNKRSHVDQLLPLSLEEAINVLFTPETPPAPPVNNYQGMKADPDVPEGESWVEAEWSEDGELQGLRMRNLKNWMGQRIQNQGLSIHQKLIFFLQSFVTNNYSDSGHAQFCYSHYKLFFDQAFGNYKEFIKQYTILPLTLQYLNGNVNVLGAPDENYARELQELFTIGKGPNSGYTEQDVREAARVLTGWTFRWPVNESVFDPWRHDSGNKEFSEFYGNRSITGKFGDPGAEELDDLLDMIFDNEECAQYLARRIYRFFVYPELSEPIEQTIINPLAQMIRDNDYELIPAIRTLLSSEHFFDSSNRGVIIKSPVDFIYGTFRTFDVQFPSNYINSLEQFKTETGPIWLMSDLGVNLGDAPSVAGWPAYYQTPFYDRTWVNATSIGIRTLRTDSMIYWGFWTPGQLLNINVLRFAQSFENVDDPKLFLEDLLEFVLGYYDPDPSLLQSFKGILLSGQQDDSYWTEAWNNYRLDPGNESYVSIVENRLKSLFQRVTQLPEFQLH